MERYYQKEIECASQEQIRSWQDERLVRQVRHVWDNVPYYRAKMEAAHIAPDDIKSRDDLYKLPFLSKADLREAYPFGLLAEPLEKCVRIHSTSGTTGKRVVAFYTKEDIDLWDDCCARALAAAGAGPEDVCQVAYGYGLFTGGFGLNGGSQKLGCLTLPMSSGNTDRQLQFMEDLGATILCCTPSYAAYLAESIHERGLQNKIHLKAGIFGAEAWSEQMRQDIQKRLGIKAYDIYGLTELSGPGVAYECSAQTGMHINEDHFIAEIIDPDTGEITEAWLFVGVMTYSMYAYVEAFINEKQKAWITAHVHMYEYFGGVAKILVPDNCLTAVYHTGDWYTPSLNTTYHELAEHYGTAIIPARVRKPKDKPGAEGTVRNVSTWITAALRNEQFFSLGELNQAIRKKLEDFSHRPFRCGSHFRSVEVGDF